MSPPSRAPDRFPELADEFGVQPEEVESFRRDGYVLLRGLLSSDEVTPYRQAIGEVIENHAETLPPLDERDFTGRAFLQVVNIWETDERVRRLTQAPRLARVAADLLEVDAIRLFWDQALYKEPGGGITPWHQDSTIMPLLDTDAVGTLWIPLVDVPDGLEFASGSHLERNLSSLEQFADDFSERSEDLYARLVRERGYRLSSPGPMRAGDATFHHGWTVHRAPAWEGPGQREIMCVIYVADGATLLVSQRDGIEGQLETLDWQPGEVAASVHTPLLYRRPR
jgi:Phytanoyl-CoA dioxygenase (PhyH)